MSTDAASRTAITRCSGPFRSLSVTWTIKSKRRYANLSSKLVAAEVFPPGEHLADELAARGWTIPQFAELMDQPVQVVADVLDAQIEVTPDLAAAISAALGTSAQLWLNLEQIYRAHRGAACRPR